MKRTFLNKATFKFLLGFNKESFQASSALLFDDEVTFGDPPCNNSFIANERRSKQFSKHSRNSTKKLHIEKHAHNASFHKKTHIYSNI